MTQTAERPVHEAAAEPLVLEAEVSLFPLIRFPWKDEDPDGHENPAYNGYLAGFMERAERLIGHGVEDIQFSVYPSLIYPQGYPCVRTMARISVLPSDSVYAAALEWDAALPNEDDDEEEPGPEVMQKGRQLEHLARVFLSKRLKEGGYCFRLDVEINGLGNTEGW